ncbi:MAG TPA: hypothetical protein VMU13_00820 [Candidatus Paceibacterota bacterium]|nr:hypothetical protein [Candidatus Paceibacterota bacterium]
MALNELLRKEKAVVQIGFTRTRQIGVEGEFEIWCRSVNEPIDFEYGVVVVMDGNPEDGDDDLTRDADRLSEEGCEPIALLRVRSECDDLDECHGLIFYKKPKG